MKILFCQPTLEYSGADICLLEITEGLHEESGHEIHLLAGKPGPLAPRFEHVVERMWWVDAPKLVRNWSVLPSFFASYWRVLRKMREIKAATDVRVAYVNTIMFPQALVAARLTGLKTIVHLHEVETTYPRTYYRLFLWFAARSAERIVCVSDYVKRQPGAARSARFQQKAHVVHNCSHFDVPAIRRGLEKPFRILAVVPIDRRKGVADLIPFAKSLGERLGKDAFLLQIVGRPADTKLYKQLRERVGRNGLSGVIEFAGEAHDMRPVYEAAHVLVHPSHSEAFPRILVEAANFSLPAVTTDAGGSPEAVVDNETGYVVPVGDPVAMAERVAVLCREPALYERMSQNAYQRYRDHFTREHMLARLRAVIDGAV